MPEMSSQDGDDNHPMLSYSRPAPTRARDITIILASAAVGAAAVAAIGFGVALLVEQEPWQFHSPAATLLFFAVALAGLTMFLVQIIPPVRRWAVLGLLLGAGVMSLIEGLCFLRP